MAKLVFAYPIEEVHGKLKGSFGAARRSSANAAGERHAFSVIYGKRNLTLHPVGTDEQANRDQFKAIAALVAARRKNAQKKVQDAVAFEAQSTYKTLTEYLWSVCTTEYTASQTQS